MFNRLKKQYKKTYKFYQKELSNFKTVMKDTNNSLVIADQYCYNCMSYALDIFDSWSRLRAFTNSYSYDDGIVDYDLLEEVFYDCCEELEEKYCVRRLSSSIEKLEENERLIAFRIGADDFHFARKNSDGTWTHKPGSHHIRIMSEDELFSEAWSKETREYPYISEIAFFAVKK